MRGNGRGKPALAGPAGPENPALGEFAKEELVQSHMPLVRAMARRYGGRGEELEDLVQVGALGLIKSSARFDPGRGVAFASFAAPAVEGEIRRHLSERTGGLRLPRETQRLSSELERCESELAAALGRSPTVAELAAALDADEREVERLIEAVLARHPVAIPGDDSAEGLPADQLEPTAESEHRVLLARGLRVLNERERRIVFLRFNADMTERQIARTLGISQAHVSRLLDAALGKLRTELAGSSAAGTTGDSTESAAISPDPGPKIDAVRAQEKGTRRPAAGEGSQSGESARRPSEDSTAPPRRPGKGKAPNGYSGRILVRMPSELHEQLAHAAEREDVSLNRYVTNALSTTVGPDHAAASDRATAPDHAAASDRATAPDHAAASDRATAPDHAAAPDRATAPDGTATPDRPAGPDGATPQLKPRTLRVAVATNLAIVVIAGVVAVILLVLALQRGL
jgi:RNA polymerase sigma factor (sigma-70 family)